jgi:hypothetical protein
VVRLKAAYFIPVGPPQLSFFAVIPAISARQEVDGNVDKYHSASLLVCFSGHFYTLIPDP